MTDSNITATPEELKALVLSARQGAREDGLTEAQVRAYANYQAGRRNTLEGEELKRAITMTEAAVRKMRSSPISTS